MSLNDRKGWGVTNLRLAFPKKKSMLFKDLSLDYHKGEKILLLGPSGCGKSTLLQVLSGLVPGSIELPMRADRHAVPGNWGFIFQDPDTQFCMPYVDEEIAFVLENRSIPRARMPQLIQHYVDMVDLKLENNHQLIRTLSGGMKQRLAIASVLALEPDVLFLDEPTALLDPKGTVQLWQTVRRIGIGRTLMIVEHKIDHVLDFIDRVVLFNHNGEIFADGPKETILTHYKKKLDDFGIWHPGVWHGYEQKQIEKCDHTFAEPILELNHLEVLRQKYVRLSIEELTIHRGEWIAIIGENGAGKSTMIEGIMGLLRTKGKLHWNFAHPEDHVQFVFQNPEYQFVADSVEDELAFSLRIKKISEDEITHRVDRALERYALKDQRLQHPFQLSIGQKRRLSVASAMINHPDVLILDEPTFGQDARNTFALLDLFQQLRRDGTTIIMVTHEMEIVSRFATRTLTIDQGKLIKDTRNEGDKGERRSGYGFDEHEHVIF
ncbi:energy-coupling factor ABC transporter ATP-binding protein [Sporolactobacillus shoreicorticis]|uniref:ABC transporter ATP-binding protein n=1 Tax=Sporolactobacillus shoreicorticis TaxID=1923877 RepID=A0ABW5S697_9BACL|nr:ABC transporter ATP-binding protein [Sporolactobacillus shoreicorticis]MCO7125760.1 energy-coupling factor ABC transporter ATP-binding protein [Sporolactobacillus shoreicorticis]